MVITPYLFFSISVASSRGSSYFGAGRNLTLEGFGSWSVSKMMFSRAPIDSFTCFCHFSHRVGGSVVVCSSNASIENGVFRDSRVAD